MTMKFRNILYLLLVICVAGCGEPDYPTPTPSVATQTSKLTIVHAAPLADETPRVQIKVDNRALSDKDTVRFEAAPDGKFYNTITMNIPAGPNRLVNFFELDEAEAALITDRYNATATTNNTAFLIRTKTADSKEVYSVRRVADDLTTPDVGFAKVRFFHFYFDPAAYTGPEVKVTPVGGGTPVFTARKYNEVSRGTTDFARFTSIAAGTYNYEVRSTADESILLTINNLKLDSKGIYTIYLKGRAPAISYGVIKH